MGFPGRLFDDLRRDLRGKWSILGVGWAGGYCHFGLLAAAMAPIVVDIFLQKIVNFEIFCFIGLWELEVFFHGLSCVFCGV